MHRFEIINHLIKANNFVNYLEIGVYRGQNIREIIAEHKDGVDPGIEGEMVPEVNYQMTSDAFFDLINDHPEIKYDLIFIDGLHHSEQVDKDIENALNHLVDNGIIVLHDCSPEQELYSLVPRVSGIWNGDVYKSVLRFRQKYSHRFVTVNTDCGCGIIFNNRPEINHCPISELQQGLESWNYFDTNRTKLLNLIPANEFKTSYF
jgi:hypothetical protein